MLPVFTPAAVPGLFLGCALSNLLTGCAVWDIVAGSLATLLGAVGTRLLRNETTHGNKTIILQYMQLSYDDTKRAMLSMAPG